MSQDRPPRSAHLQLIAVAWNFGWPIAAGVALGHWLDLKLGSSPAATLGLGLGALVVAVWRLLVLSREEVQEDREERDARDGEDR